MKPTSTHWADITAIKIVKANEGKDTFTVASGITPSGKVHVGNFREVITVDLVARALKSLGKKVRFLYSWDNFDTFRKVPKNLPKPDEFEPFLRKPIARIPDPWNQAETYSQGRINLFEAELKKVGINPDYKYQEQMYSTGKYAELIRQVLERKQEIADILNEHRTSPLAENWLPTSIYCSECQKDDMHSQSYLGEWSYSYHCAGCEHKETVDIRESKNLKLIWRVDWPMRWHFEQVDFEPGGKDHSSQGGSFDTGKKIIKAIWQEDAPMYLQYDFVMIKGGTGKMSSSSGQLFTLTEVLDVYDPQIIRWIFANHRPNHDFSLAFDEDVIKIYEEFDRAEAAAFEPEPKKPGKWAQNKRTYELSLIEGELPQQAPKRAGFRILCNRLQICNKDPQRTFARYYSREITNEKDIASFYERCACAINWLEKHAPEEFCYEILESPKTTDINTQEQKTLEFFRNLVNSVDLEQIEPKALNEMIYEQVIHKAEIEPKMAFKLIYNRLIDRDQGPRLPGFLKEIGKNKLLQLI